MVRDVSNLTISSGDDGWMLQNCSVLITRFVLGVFSLFYQFTIWPILIGSSLGEEEELEVEQEEEQKGPDLKLASRRDMYSICQSVGLG